MFEATACWFGIGLLFTPFPREGEGDRPIEDQMYTLSRSLLLHVVCITGRPCDLAKVGLSALLDPKVDPSCVRASMRPCHTHKIACKFLRLQRELQPCNEHNFWRLGQKEEEKAGNFAAPSIFIESFVKYMLRVHMLASIIVTSLLIRAPARVN